MGIDSQRARNSGAAATTTEAPASVWTRVHCELKSLDASMELTALLQELLRMVRGPAPDHAAGIFLWDERTRTVQGQTSETFDPGLNLGDTDFQTVLSQKLAYVISSVDEQHSSAATADGASRQMVVPFQMAQARGALVVRSENGAFSEADGHALAKFVRKAAPSIENGLLHQRVGRVSNIERELAMAQEIMARMIPREPPSVPGFQVGSAYVPAKAVGGDLINYIVLPDDHYGFLVADASGKGVPAALLMTGFRALFRALIVNNFNIRSVFRRANNQLLMASTAPSQFVSAFYGALDATTGRLIYVNAGHVPPLLYRPRHPVRQLEIGGPVLGILRAASYHEDSVVLHPQDILICFSDGLSEAEDAAGESFDRHHILKVVEEHQGETAQAICGALQQEVARFSNRPLQDDLTICVLKYP